MSNPDTLQQRNRELSILNTIAGELNRSVDLEQILRAALAQVSELLNLDTSWIWLIRSETGESYLAASQNLPPALTEDPGRMEGRCYCLDTYRNGDLKGAANVNVVTCSRLQGLVKGTDGLLYHASIPLYAHGKKLGVLNVASTAWRKLSPEDLRMLNTVGDLLSIAVERARLFDQSLETGAIEERFRLARDLHDTLGQGLAAILLKLETVDALLDDGGEIHQISEALHQTMSLTRSNLDEARRSVQDLRAAPLEDRTLSEALDALSNSISEGQDLEIRFSSVGGSRPLPVRIEAGLYRIAHEALNNVILHANASLVNVQLNTSPDQVHMVIEDNGCGFDPEAIPDDRYGLVGLNERTRLLDGTLLLESAVGKGTRIEIRLPLEREN